MSARIDITAQRFGRVTAIRPGDFRGNALFWHIRCDCGTEKQVRGNDLRCGNIVSCGCMKTERIVAVQKSRAPRHDGLTVAEWAARLGISHSAVRARIHDGIPLQRPRRKGPKKVGKRDRLNFAMRALDRMARAAREEQCAAS